MDEVLSVVAKTLKVAGDIHPEMTAPDGNKTIINNITSEVPKIRKMLQKTTKAAKGIQKQPKQLEAARRTRSGQKKTLPKAARRLTSSRQTSEIINQQFLNQ